MAVTKDVTETKIKAETTDYVERLRIQREEGQYAQHKATQSSNFAAYLIAEVLQNRSETKKENRNIIQSISVLSAQHLLYPNGMTPGFAVTPAGKRHTEKIIRMIDISRMKSMSTA